MNANEVKSCPVPALGYRAQGIWHRALRPEALAGNAGQQTNKQSTGLKRKDFSLTSASLCFDRVPIYEDWQTLPHFVALNQTGKQTDFSDGPSFYLFPE